MPTFGSLIERSASSANLLDAPITLRGWTALSVEIMSRRSAPKRAAVLINRLGAIAVKNLGHQRAVQNISENGCVKGFAGRRKLHIDFVEILFGMVEKNQEARVASSERFDKSGPNATSCSCD
jgi:hypothetical protein